MFFELTQQEMLTFFGFGIIVNFLFSFMFGWYMSKNIGIEEMIQVTGQKRPPLWQSLMLFVPFAKMGLTLFRVTILQFWFLNQGKTHKDYWIYLTH